METVLSLNIVLVQEVGIYSTPSCVEQQTQRTSFPSCHVGSRPSSWAVSSLEEAVNLLSLQRL